MKRILHKIHYQIPIAKSALVKDLRLNNYRNIANTVSYILAIMFDVRSDILCAYNKELFFFFQMYRTFLPDNSFVTPSNTFYLAGTIVEEGSYDAENLLGVEEVDTSCIRNFNPLINEVCAFCQVAE